MTIKAVDCEGKHCNSNYQTANKTKSLQNITLLAIHMVWIAEES